jgi:hypothetical protein
MQSFLVPAGQMIIEEYVYQELDRKANTIQTVVNIFNALKCLGADKL